MATAVTILVNHSSEDEVVGSSGIDWVTMNVGTDSIVFTNGSDTVADGQPVPSSFQLSSAGMVLNGTTQVVPVYLLSDFSANMLKQIFLMGPNNAQYVMAFSFNGATTSEPVLEAWDNSGLSTINSVSLGSGTPSNSWLRGVTTTTGLPGVNWSGSTLAGSSDSHFLWLNNLGGALTGTTVLYCNLQMVIPATQTQGGAETPVLTIKYTTT